MQAIRGHINEYTHKARAIRNSLHEAEADNSKALRRKQGTNILLSDTGGYVTQVEHMARGVDVLEVL